VAAAVTAAVLTIGPVGVAWAGTGAGDRPAGCAWTQWGGDATHQGRACAVGQRGLRLVDRITVDPFAAQKSAEDFGDLPVHYATPLVAADGGVYAMEVGGTFVPCDPPGSGQPAPCGFDNTDHETWSEHAYQWRGGHLVPRYMFTSDWKPLPGTFEGMFQAAMTDRYLYVPGAGGTVFQLDRRSGAALGRIDPFGTAVDPQRHVASGITVDARGDVYYTVIRPDSTAPDADVRSWLVRVGPDGTTRLVDIGTLIAGAPAATDLCYSGFGDGAPVPPGPLPPPPQPDGSPTLPPQFPCQSQRAAVNAAPAVGVDGTVFIVTRANSPHASNYAYLAALGPDLHLRWAASLRGRLADGCGVSVPYGPGPRDCRPGSTLGVDPRTNLPPAGQAVDVSSAAPVALPDGGVAYGAFTLYNGFRGHLMAFDRAGGFTGAFDFGWDITPAVYPHDHTYSLVTKENHYDTNGPFRVTRLGADLRAQWSFTNTSTQTCRRAPDGTVVCEDDGQHPSGFEWCISAPAVDRAGTVYGASEDGNFYAIDRYGHQVQRVFLETASSEAYTPAALDAAGRVYAQNNGILYVLAH
jgi:hypothetical protein